MSERKIETNNDLLQILRTLQNLQRCIFTMENIPLSGRADG